MTGKDEFAVIQSHEAIGDNYSDAGGLGNFTRRALCRNATKSNTLDSPIRWMVVDDEHGEWMLELKPSGTAAVWRARAAVVQNPIFSVGYITSTNKLLVMSLGRAIG